MKILCFLVFVCLGTSKLISINHRQIVSVTNSDFDSPTVLHTSSFFQIKDTAKTIRTLNVPDVFQATDYTCGPASLTAVLNYYSIMRRETELAQLALTDEQVGTDPYDLYNAVLKLNLEAKMYQNLTVSTLEEFLKVGRPVILLLQAWKDDDDPTPYPIDYNNGHYVVAIGLDNQNIYFQDPWIFGNLGYIKKTQLQGRWHGNTVYPKDRVIYGFGLVVLQRFRQIPTVIRLQ